MKKTLQKRTFSVVLQLEPHRKYQPSPSAHMILNHCDLDDDGHICLSSSMDAREMLEAIDSLKSELDGLANEIVSWLALTVAQRRAQLSVISNDNTDLVETEKGGRGLNS